ncbi:uncharacterized protein LOC112153494 [Oryzias melastigma]|uniref:uncharacterized protein LOC112153494 n=1 Tax=Oryzias melastigma TaxID=30732 RepID=UPI000CF7FD85|nr:uncharacterized protein LOC112153494 [Oryzias melastigma]
MFRDAVLQRAPNKPKLMVTLDLESSETDRERDIICFYKQANIDWSRPFEARLRGDVALGDGVTRHFFSLVLEKLSCGLHLPLDNCGGRTLIFVGEEDHRVPSTSGTLVDGDLFRVVGRIIGHSFLNRGPLLCGLSNCLLPLICGDKLATPVFEMKDCPDTDITDIVFLLESERDLTEVEKGEVNQLAMSWDLPMVTIQNRRWLAERVLYHGVIGRRLQQIAQIRAGLKDTGVLQMLKQRPDLATVLFPRGAEEVLEPEFVLQRVLWPEPDSDEEDNIEVLCKATSFLRAYIESASSSELRQLVQFWTGWTVVPEQMTVEVEADLTFPVASTCFTTLKIPGRYETFPEFSNSLKAAVATTQFGFGRV